MRRFLLWTVAGLCIAGVPAHADLVINPFFDTSGAGAVSASQQTLITEALAAYSRYSNDATINIYFEDMSSGLGQSETQLYAVPFTDFRSALANEAANDGMQDQATALASLPNTTNNPVTATADLAMSTADMLAMGICDQPSDCPAFSLVQNNGVSIPIEGIVSVNFGAGNYDYTAVVQHEVDEVLGLGSGLNLPAADINQYPRPQDLYRYGASGVRSYTTSTSAASYFSINGGATNLVNFNQSGTGDYGDWYSCVSNFPGPYRVQDACGTPGTSPTMGVEYTALDAIGYRTPEPATWGMVMLAFGAVALGRRRSMRQKV